MNAIHEPRAHPDRAPSASPAANSLLEAVGDGVLLLRRNTDSIAVEWASRRFFGMTGLDPGAVLNHAPAFLSLARADGSVLPVAAVFASPDSALLTLRSARGDVAARGSWRPLDESGTAVLLTVTDLGRPTAPDTAAGDPSFSVVAAHLLNLVTLLDRSGIIQHQYGSPRVIGRDPALRRGRSVLEFVHMEDAGRMRDWLARLAAVPCGTGIEDIALRILHGDGAWRAVRLRGTNLLDEPGVHGLLAETHDETARTLAELAADQTRDHLRLAAEGVRMGFFEYDVVADTVEISNECYVMRGFTPPTGHGPIGGEYLRQPHPADEAALREGWNRVIAGPQNDWDTEFRVPARPGDWIWVHLRARVLERDAAGRARRIVGILLDVDRRKRAERGLSHSEARYRTVVAMSPGFLHESAMNADGRLMFRWASEGFTRILGWTIEEVNERGGFATLVHPEHRLAAAARRADALSGEPVRGETRLLAKSGEYVWFAVSAFPLQEPETGRVISMMGSLHDITGLKLAEERLRTSEERFRVAADAVSGIIYERDVATSIVNCSSAVGDVLGYGPEAMRAPFDWWVERTHPDDVERFVAERLYEDDDRRIVSSRYRLRHADGHYVDVLDRAVRVRDASGEIVRLVGCAMDVSRERRAERLLREAEALAHVGSWEMDLRRQELTWSDEAHRIHRTTRESFVPSLDAAISFYAPDSVPIIRAAIKRAMATGEGFDLELEIITADGERRWVRTNGRVERVGGEPVRLYGAFQDIDALKRSERRIQEQSDWLRLAMDAAQVLAWRWNPLDDRLTVEYRSPAFDDSIPVSATLADDLKDVHPDDRARLLDALTRTATTGHPAELEFRVTDSVGRLRWLAIRVIQATVDGYAVVIGTTHDATARRAAEDALRASEAVLRSVSENSPDYIVVADGELNVTFVNRGSRGRSAVVAVGSPFASTPTADSIDMERRLRAVLATGRPVRFESRAHDPDGAEVLVENRVGPVEQGGKVVGVIVYSTDITDRRALEREILEISNREQRRIGSDLHDGLGQELTGIALMLRGLTSAVQRGVPLSAPDLEEVVGLVNGAIDTTRTLARGLSPVALEGGGLVYALRALAARAREMYGLDVRFRSRITPRVTLDAAATGHLYRIAQESLTNTARHAKAKQVTIQFTVRGRRVMLAVTDDGRGIAGGTGSGMGLKIMRYRAHMLGGELTIEPAADGRGTRIACTLAQPDPEVAPVARTGSE